MIHLVTIAQTSDMPAPRDRELDPAVLCQQVTTLLSTFVAGRTAAARGQGLPTEVPEAVGEFLGAGGKRIRPLLCVLGWHAAYGKGAATPVLHVGAALEMFHAFCLIHDDVMDHSDTRRARPTVHRVLAERNCGGRTPSEAANIGVGAAILAGDLALIWSEELLRARAAGLDASQRERVLPLIDVMRAEVLYGQYLDLAATGQPTADVNRALQIVRFKTAKYTVERPLQIGAALAGADEEILAQLSAFALPLGEAFQLRDDILGVFGQQDQTGKPVLDDLREGKHTALIALALKHASRTRADQLRRFLGHSALTEDQADVARCVITATGAPVLVEGMIQDRYEQALTALDAMQVPADVRRQLRELADQMVRRAS